MSEIVFNIVYELADFLLLILLISSFFVINRNHSIKYFLIFQTYIILCSADNLALELLRYYNYLEKVNWIIFQLLLSTIHFGLLSFFLLKQLNKRSSYVNFLFIFILSLLIIFNFLDYKNSNYYSATISNIGLIIFCLFYYVDILKGNLDIDLKSNPMFLIASGLFLGSGLSTPILLFGNHLRVILDHNTYYWVAILSPVSSIIMYSIFLKSFLCIHKIKK